MDVDDVDLYRCGSWSCCRGSLLLFAMVMTMGMSCRFVFGWEQCVPWPWRLKTENYCEMRSFFKISIIIRFKMIGVGQFNPAA